MAEKKTAAVRQTKKTAAQPNRRRYASAGAIAADKCSVEKRGAEDRQALPKAPANQPRFVHQSNSKGETSSDKSRGFNPKQRAGQQWFSKVKTLGVRGIREQWVGKIKKIKTDLPQEAFSEPDNAPKNRYDDVGLLDKSRVKVKLNPDKDDYIHASFVEVRPDLTFICAQGPLFNTISQFWLMCIQEEVKVVLQLCQNYEDGKNKCAEYLPPGSEEVEHGPVRVRVVRPATSVPGTKKVSKTLVQCKFEDREITLTHVLYYGWPDHSVAESVPTCREVRQLLYKLYDKKPIVLHCSAGIGRTGSFAAIEMVCSKVLNDFNGDFSMIDLMQELRNQRTLAVQNDKQYVFIFRCVIEILIAEEALSKTADVTAFIQSYDSFLLRVKMNRPRVTPSKSAKRAADKD